jgi:hypothetical protein
VPDFPPAFVYKGEPLDALYWRYSLRCRVEREIDKAYYGPQLLAIYDLILPLIDDWADCRLISDQALQRMIGKADADGTFRATFSNAPVGGLQRLTRDTVQKVGSQYLADNAHLIAKFDDDGRIDPRFFTADHPRCVHFFLTEIFALRRRLRHDRAVVFQSLPHDFTLRIGGYDHQIATSRAHPLNQAIDIAIWQGAISEADADALVESVGAITGARQVWKSETGFRGETFTDEAGTLRLRYGIADQIEDAVDGHNRFGAAWVDVMGGRYDRDGA